MTQTNQPPTPSSLDIALGKIDALIAAKGGGEPAAPTTKQMTQTEVHAYLAAEIEKGLAEKPEIMKARLEHAKAQVLAAKAVFDTGATLATVTMFQDPWQTKPGESATKGTADPQQPAISPTTDGSNVQFRSDVIFTTTEKGAKPTELLKALVTVAKASETAPAHTKLVAKGEEGKAIIAKAGEARAILDKIATMFGIMPEEPEDVLDCEFRWSISDTISALQSAAKLEGVMAGMTAALMSKSATPSPTRRADDDDADYGPGEWPSDMSSAVYDEKAGTYKTPTAS